ncbi:hypothetical protein HELRODRAFT_173100 [Helobdella robusta]|uniref:Uncharacterized protein n=1 Tax=Helobdella robusta TaxID=6412 RepID=T1F6C4_HELRO|nr:hypothetical protein HELRODRAFT_173100 [Helobdella robusta]ESO04029.1 hypothetical protein HELRODRAFT_173100 [Helobdella robusta]
MDFYNCEDIRIAKKILTSDLDALNLEKDDKIKPNSSGNSKKDKVSDLILTIKTILSNKIESKLPQYAALNLFKIPSSKKAKFESILDEKLKKLEELFIEERNIFREIVNDAAINNSPKVERKQQSDCKTESSKQSDCDGDVRKITKVGKIGDGMVRPILVRFDDEKIKDIGHSF